MLISSVTHIPSPSSFTISEYSRPKFRNHVNSFSTSVLSDHSFGRSQRKAKANANANAFSNPDIISHHSRFPLFYNSENASAQKKFQLGSSQSDSNQNVSFDQDFSSGQNVSSNQNLPSSSSTENLNATDDVATLTSERQKIFNNIAPIYDNFNDILSLGQHHIWKRMTVQWSNVRPGDRVLDVCCGSGDIALLLAEKVTKSGQVYGLDFAPEQLEIAKQKQKKSFTASKVDMSWVEGDALSLPFPSEFFDAVTMGYGLRNVADISKSLNEILRVLKYDCTASILDFNNPSDPFTSAFQGFALENVVVPLASQFGLEEEYKYVKPSIQRFPRGREQERLAMAEGFSKARHYEIAGGLMGVLVLTK